ncbi:MAG: DUF2203 family protein [Gemmatimonadota bacterium]|nr:DUF2203 family protein [Gemmatimonadota bacterium]
MKGAAWPGTRIWTPDEAAGALALVRRIAADLAVTYADWRDAIAAYEYAAAAASAATPSPDADRLMGEAQRHAGEIDALRSELARLDIRVVRLEPIVLAFRSRRSRGIEPVYWTPGPARPSYDWPEGVPTNGTAISWPSRAHDTAGKTSRA